jgi:hypothetical protein
MLSVVKAVGPQLTGARAELSLLSEQLKTATTGLEQARLPEQRLIEAVQAYERAAADLAALKATHMAAVGYWLANPQGSTPQSPVDMIAAERKVEEHKLLADAARERLPSATAAVSRASMQVGAVHRLFEDAAMRAVVETARDYAFGSLRSALNAALTAEAALEGLERLLLERGHRDGDGSPAHRAALAVGQLRREARAGSGVPHNLKPARKLLNSIVDDPGAVLEIG